MERSDYDPSEAAIHIARYSIARPHVAGKRILDVACGEGYGARLLHEWGAVSVTGVDISIESIDVAKRLFNRDGISFHVGEASALVDMFGSDAFDMVVSFETIEHLENPQVFLHQISIVLKTDGVVMMTCPNDYWYYNDEEEANNFHVNQFTLEEFVDLFKHNLGEPDWIGFGAPFIGYINIPADQLGTRPSTQGAMVEGSTSISALTLPSGPLEPTSKNASYFVAVRGAKAQGSVAGYPLAMDAYSDPARGETAASFKAWISDLNARLNDSREAYESAASAIDERDKLIRANEARAVEFETTIAAQARLIDERDSLIRKYEPFVSELKQLSILHSFIRRFRSSKL